jgi:hypothetical protein
MWCSNTVCGQNAEICFNVKAGDAYRFHWTLNGKIECRLIRNWPTIWRYNNSYLTIRNRKSELTLFKVGAWRLRRSCNLCGVEEDVLYFVNVSWLGSSGKCLTVNDKVAYKRMMNGTNVAELNRRTWCNEWQQDSVRLCQAVTYCIKGHKRNLDKYIEIMQFPASLRK